MNESSSAATGPFTRPSLLLPAGATLLVLALLIESLGRSDLVAVTMGVAGAVTAAGAWLMATLAPPRLDPVRGTRFLSIASIALSVTPLLGPSESWVGLFGVIGLWIAVGGAAIEWRRGRTYRLGRGG